ncbi:MAG: TrkH family potassium uptake protein [Tissierellia bacterium]|nr:TrkH family potassium uptake protein [Tissierellia bacterium]
MSLIGRIKEQIEKNPPRLLAFGFLLVILVGSIILSLPISSASGEYTNLLDASFTATSAVCVTGLATVNTLEYWSSFGHFIILMLIQFGGLGFMTWAILIALIMKKRITLKERLVIHEQMNAISLQGMVRLVIYVLKATFIIEIAGAVLLGFTFIPRFGIGKGIWYSIFHSISAYCNAGFDLIGSESLAPFAKSIMVILPISFLIMIGGIGFSVIMDITSKKKFKHFTAHAKLALSVSATLVLTGMVIFFLLEYGNENTIKSFSLYDKILASFFQSVTTRTAGFCALNQAMIRDSSAVVSIVLMFIGGSPAGTAGGVKTTTMGLLFYTTLSEIKGQSDVNMFNRRIPFNTVRKALAVVIISMCWVLLITLILTVTESNSFINLLFEATSAFGTVGLSRSVTPTLTNVGKMLIMITMYLGRLGPMTLAFAFTKRQTARTYREPRGDILVG